MQQFNLPEAVKTDIFTPMYGYGVQNVHTWNKPSWARSIFIVCISGGGGGGGGCSGPADSQRGGGAGGSGGSVARGFLPSSFCPSTLFIKVGQGGAGGGPDSSGESGVASTVGLWVDGDGTLSSYSFLVTTDTAIGGPPGTTAAGGASVSVSGSITTYFKCLYTKSGGRPSGAGGATGAGGNGTQQPPSLGGGYGGAGCAAVYSAAGGGSYGNGFSPLYGNSPGTGTGAAGGGGQGPDGITVWLPGEYVFSSLGGSGGGNANTGLGGNGGNGGLGAGGGGGGAGFTGGRGGAGGDGAVIIACW